MIESFCNSICATEGWLQVRFPCRCKQQSFSLLQLSLHRLLVNSLLSLIVLKKRIKQDHIHPIFSLPFSVRRQTSGIHCYSDLQFLECHLHSLLGTWLFFRIKMRYDRCDCKDKLKVKVFHLKKEFSDKILLKAFLTFPLVYSLQI